ncbi:hypothetical protein LTR05_008380 [Lithohypha guttulata]|uniref:Uncharacterized protein n=1 Tax=Lithohypha guttulata TaxID=1690604 RepID=A0AAN7QAH1_9EURO|nr:hypothetical protein LTR05_008380 [Lithohypha guttulata]
MNARQRQNALLLLDIIWAIQPINWEETATKSGYVQQEGGRSPGQKLQQDVRQVLSQTGKYKLENELLVLVGENNPPPKPRPGFAKMARPGGER